MIINEIGDGLFDALIIVQSGFHIAKLKRKTYLKSPKLADFVKPFSIYNLGAVNSFDGTTLPFCMRLVIFDNHTT